MTRKILTAVAAPAALAASILTTADPAAAARDLRARFGPDRVLARGPAYDRARQLWNGAVDHRPALIVRPGTAAEVQAAVLTARTYDLPISVRGGGQDWAGRRCGPAAGHRPDRDAAGHGEPRARIATGGGATAHEVIAAAPHDLVAATATCGSVGLAGLTSAYGPLTGRFGLPGQLARRRGRPGRRPRHRRRRERARTVLGDPRRPGPQALDQPLEGRPQRLRHHLQRPPVRRTEVTYRSVTPKTDADLDGGLDRSRDQPLSSGTWIESGAGSRIGSFRAACWPGWLVADLRGWAPIRREP